MKLVLKFAVFILIAVSFITCKKTDYSARLNKSPDSRAGLDQIINFPTDNVSLDGSASNDADGVIDKYQWAKIYGPDTFAIVNAASAKTVVRELVKGVYGFELKVTDNGGLFSRDTVQVVVNDPTQPNQPPVADAGADQFISLPNNSVTFSGYASSDADGIIISYLWVPISGPNQSAILNPNSVSTDVTGLIKGTYRFRLEVRDNSGATDDDTVAVIVNRPDSIPVINTQMIWVGKLSRWRVATAAATAGNKILFAGGVTVDNDNQITAIFPTVDIYDFTANSWSTTELSQAGYSKLAASAGNKILFAGGWIPNGVETRVDIYDVVTNGWSTAELSDSRMYDKAAVGSGNKVFFTGGGYPGSPWSYDDNDFSNRVEIYDASLNTWSTASLSEARTAVQGGTTGTKTIFAGGYKVGGESNQADIYDAATNSWTTTSLSEPRWVSAVTTVGNKIIFAGGGFVGSPLSSNRVDIYDAASGNWSIESLDRFEYLSPNKPINLLGAATSGNYAVFFPENIPHFMIYDAVTGKWGLSSPVPPLGWEAAFVTANNQIYIAGWEGVWRVQF